MESAHHDTTRLEMFSDGVFAIAITLLIIEIAVPDFADGAKEARHALVDQWPSYLSYAIGFITIGSIWMNHHHIFRYIRSVNQPFLFVNVLFLMTVAFLPWVTAVLAEGFRHGAERRLAVTIYLAALTVMAWLFNGVWFSARSMKLDDGDAEHRRAISRSYPAGASVITLSFIVSFVSEIAAILLYALVVAFYIAKGPEARLRRQRAASAEQEKHQEA